MSDTSTSYDSDVSCASDTIVTDFSDLSLKEANKGYRKLKHETLWKRNVSKARKDSGKSYQNKNGFVVEAKKLKSISKCCQKNCFQNVPMQDQATFFKSFWDIGNKDAQDQIVVHSLVPCTPKRRVVNSTFNERISSWKYKISVGCTTFDVCKNFFISLLQISPKRVRIIQQKLNAGQLTIKDMRGKHSNRPHKIKNMVWKMVDEHWASIPSSQSHYSLNKTKKLYYDNPDLNVKKLFELFKEYFKEKTGEDLQMKYETYHRYFRTNSQYAFRQPRSDVCDFCSQSKILLRENPNDPCKAKYDLHLKKNMKSTRR